MTSRSMLSYLSVRGFDFDSCIFMSMCKTSFSILVRQVWPNLMAQDDSTYEPFPLRNNNDSSGYLELHWKLLSPKHWDSCSWYRGGLAAATWSPSDHGFYIGSHPAPVGRHDHVASHENTHLRGNGARPSGRAGCG